MKLSNDDKIELGKAGIAAFSLVLVIYILHAVYYYLIF